MTTTQDCGATQGCFDSDEATARAAASAECLDAGALIAYGAPRIETCASVHLDVNTMHCDEAANVLAQSFIGREDSVPRSTDTGNRVVGLDGRGEHALPNA
jgi:hypothetical protein